MHTLAVCAAICLGPDDSHLEGVLLLEINTNLLDDLKRDGELVTSLFVAERFEYDRANPVIRKRAPLSHHRHVGDVAAAGIKDQGLVPDDLRLAGDQVSE